MARGAQRVGWLAFLLALAFILPAFAQTNEVQSVPPANRYLLVIETSGSMQRRAPGTLNALVDLLGSGFHGQLHPEDTLGVWTFNEDLYTGRFPLQHWSPQNQAAIGNRILTFLNEQKYEKQPDFSKLLPALDQLVKNSPFITIILVTDGEDKIHGTPFDSRINDAFQVWRERQQKDQMPFLLVLRGKQGTLTDCTVTSAPWPVEMPALPPELQLSEVVVRKAPPAPKPPAATVPPLIVHGKKGDPAKAAALAPAPEGTNANAVPVAQPAVVPSTNSPASLSASLVSSNVASVPQTLSEPVSSPVPAGPATVPGARAAAASSSNHNPAAPSAPGRRKPLWPAVVVLSAAVLGLAILVIRRSRPAPTASLITRSLEQQHK